MVTIFFTKAAQSLHFSARPPIEPNGDFSYTVHLSHKFHFRNIKKPISTGIRLDIKFYITKDQFYFMVTNFSQSLPPILHFSGRLQICPTGDFGYQIHLSHKFHF